MRQFIQRSAVEHGLDSTETFQAQLVATEAVTNAMRHAECDDGASGPILVACRWHDDGLTIEVGDRGRFRPPRPPESLAESGRGLGLIERFTNRFELETGDDGTRLRMLVGQAA
jgi:anti-sigma regulatory factor (Ser/Thr protein kinase)